MPDRICSICNKSENLKSKIRSPICRACSMVVNPRRANTGQDWHLHHGTGYIIKSCDGKPMIYQHRYVMEQFLNRKLKPDEIVHHINGDKTDNRIENLELSNRQAHMSHHVTERNELFHQHIKAANTRWRNI